MYLDSNIVATLYGVAFAVLVLICAFLYKFYCNDCCRPEDTIPEAEIAHIREPAQIDDLPEAAEEGVVIQEDQPPPLPPRSRPIPIPGNPRACPPPPQGHPPLDEPTHMYLEYMDGVLYSIGGVPVTPPLQV